VLVRVKPEWKAAHNTKPFDHVFHDRYWEPNLSWFWNPPSNPDNPPLDPAKPPPSKLDDDNPKLDAVRGKIVILQDFYGPRYGISYSTLNEQDDYEMKNERELYNKWLKVKDQLAAANHENTDVMYINYLSGGGGTLPWFVASGHYESGTKDNRLTTGKTTPAWNGWKDFPRLDCLRNVCTIAYEGTNVLTYERVGKDYKNRVGIIMADFPGGGLIDRVIAMNDCFKTTSHCSTEAKPFIRK
jgi:1-phosphatidylinositol phosphodiesterase